MDHVLTLDAVGDGITNSSTRIQEQIDSLSANGGGIILCPPGDIYVANFVLKTGVVLVGQTSLQKPWVNVGTQFRMWEPGTHIDTPDENVSGCGIIGIGLHGNGADEEGTGIRFRDVTRGILRDITLNNFSNEGIKFDSGAKACFIERVYAQNCVLNRERDAHIGVLDIDGTDHWISDCEITSSQTELANDERYICALVIRSANSQIQGFIAEISETGILYDENAFYNRTVNSRADLNLGNGIEVLGHQNSFASVHATRNSQAGNNLWSGFSFASTGRYNVLSACISGSIGLDTLKQKYGYEDLTEAASEYNRFDACGGTNNVTALFNRNPYPSEDPGVIGMLYQVDGVLKVSS